MKYLLTIDTYSTLDSYEQGQIGDYNNIGLEDIIYTSDETELKAIVAEYLQVNTDLLYEDDNRVMYSYLSDESGVELDSRELEAWKQDKLRAYTIDQNITIERVTAW